VRVFIGWSGEVSRKVAGALHDWLRLVLQNAEPYMSQEDTSKGVLWSPEVTEQLAASSFGIFCVTPENPEASWLAFEAGALWMSVETARVVPFLFGIDEVDVTGPLKQFQAARYDRDDVLRLVQTINAGCEPVLGDEVLRRTFEQWWPVLCKALDPVAELPEAVSQGQTRSLTDMLREVVDLSRAHRKQLSAQAELIPAHYLEMTIRAAASGISPELLADFELAFGGLLGALEAYADTEDPRAAEIGAHAARLRSVYERIVARRSPRHTLRSRIIDEQRRLTWSGG
jgi:hypothetical protein